MKLLKNTIVLVLAAVALSGCFKEAGPEKQVFASIKAAEIEAGVCMSELLLNRDFEAIETKLREAEAAYRTDPEKEIKLGQFFEALYKKDPSFESFHHDYVKAYPESELAYLSRGIFYLAMAWLKRGTRAIALTSGSQLEGMEHYLELAKKDLLKAKEIDPKHPQIYARLIIAYMAHSGNKAKIREILSEGLQHNPYSFDIRYRYLNSILPRWGGSLKEMEAFIEKIKPYTSHNRRLEALEGRVSAEIGDSHLFDGNPDRALRFYNKALGFGECFYYYNQKGMALAALGKAGQAYYQITKAIELYPSYEFAHQLKVKLSGAF